jgi:hypothetical protein
MQLFVARDRRDKRRHDVGSVLCLNLLEHLDDSVRVTEVTRSTRNPPWLVGTPTLHLSTGEILKGHEAVVALQTLALRAAEERGANAPKEKKRSAGITPSVNLRPERRAEPERSEPERSELERSEHESIEMLWETQIIEGDEPSEESRKLSGDDLARAMQSRQAPAQPDRPPPPPLG